MEWKVRIEETEYVARDLSELRSWNSAGQIPPGSYVFHPMFQKWMYARDLEELRGGPVGAPPSMAGAVAGVRARSGVVDGVKLGVGMFIILPLIIVVLLFLLSFMGVATCAGIASSSGSRGSTASSPTLTHRELEPLIQSLENVGYGGTPSLFASTPVIHESTLNLYIEPTHWSSLEYRDRAKLCDDLAAVKAWKDFKTITQVKLWAHPKEVGVLTRSTSGGMYCQSAK